MLDIYGKNKKNKVEALKNNINYDNMQEKRK